MDEKVARYIGMGVGLAVVFVLFFTRDPYWSCYYDNCWLFTYEVKHTYAHGLAREIVSVWDDLVGFSYRTEDRLEYIVWTVGLGAALHAIWRYRDKLRLAVVAVHEKV